MPAYDRFHSVVRHALVKEGWTITHDPLRLDVGERSLHVDLGAERLLGAERGTERIAVEVKSFVGASDITDLHLAIGQYVVYRALLDQMEPDRTLFLAVPAAALYGVFREDIGQILIRRESLRLFGFDPVMEVIVEWIP